MPTQMEDGWERREFECQGEPSLCDNPRGCGCQKPSKPHPSCKTPEGCRENGCLGWCDEHSPDPALKPDIAALKKRLAEDQEFAAQVTGDRPPTPVGWSDTDWLKHLEEIRQDQAVYHRGPLGALEHPAFTLAWARYGLPRPDTKAEHWTPGICGGFSAYVEQGRYGHPVKKATWLYVHGVRLQDLPQLRWGHTPDNRGGISKNQDWRGGMDKWRDATGHRLANATPPAFRDLLLSIARQAHNAKLTCPPRAGHRSDDGQGNDCRAGCRGGSS